MAGFAFGSGFGSTPQTTASTFGTLGSSAPSGFSFSGGTATTNPAFPTFSQPSSTGFGFGQPATSSAPSTGFGFGGGFGSNVNTSATNFAFGGLSSTAPTTSAGLSFGSFGAAPAATQSSLFGAPATQNPFGSTFGAPQGSAFGTGSLFSTGLGSGFQAGTSTAQTGTTAINPLKTAVTLPTIFNDERDAILAKWNQLQAAWGTGKGYYTAQGNPVQFTQTNPYCRFKAVGYNALPKAKNEDGLVALIFGKKITEVLVQQAQLVDTIHKLLGSKNALTVNVDGIFDISGGKTEFVIYVVEKFATGTSRRVPANELQAYFEQLSLRTHVQNAGITHLFAKVAPTDEKLNQYLENPPAGMDRIIWQQAIKDNPDPQNLIPVPMVGFIDLHKRLKLQECQIKQHQQRLNIIADEIADLQRQHTSSLARIEEYKRKQAELAHRALKVMVAQEVTRKLGFGIHPEEEQLRVVLESILAELNAPTQFKGHLNELLSQIKLQNNQLIYSSSSVGLSLDENLVKKIKEHLQSQQQGINHLVDIIKKDVADLKIIETSLKSTAEKRI